MDQPTFLLTIRQLNEATDEATNELDNAAYRRSDRSIIVKPG
ncbi:hypothetical protein [Paenibacillus mellifer]|nr:hypothetical protein [Paenibacillus mellifer]